MNKMYFLEHIYCPAGTKTLERELAQRLGEFESHVFDHKSINELVEKIKAMQEEIRKDRPRLQPIDISFKFDSSQWNHGLQHIVFGQCSICFKEITGFTPSVVPASEIEIMRAFCRDSLEKYTKKEELKSVIREIDTNLGAMISINA